jgi:hypothetical protein
MAIDEPTRTRILAGEAAGLKLVARFKKQEYACTVKLVVEGQDPLKKVYILEHDGSEHSSLSAAGSAVMGGTACNGWRFWSLEGHLQEPKPAKEPKQPKEPKADADAAPKRKPGRPARMIKLLKDQSGVAEHMTRYFCSGEMNSFDAPSSVLRPDCPKGHTWDQTPE